MARYLISYLDGETDTVEADRIHCDDLAHDYTFSFSKDGEIVALAPVDNVRSVLRNDDQPDTAISYPYQDGDVLVLGPEVFATTDGEAISWKGANYHRRPLPSLLGTTAR